MFSHKTLIRRTDRTCLFSSFSFEVPVYIHIFYKICIYKAYSTKKKKVNRPS